MPQSCLQVFVPKGRKRNVADRDLAKAKGDLWVQLWTLGGLFMKMIAIKTGKMKMLVDGN